MPLGINLRGDFVKKTTPNDVSKKNEILRDNVVKRTISGPVQQRETLLGRPARPSLALRP
jgi:hypothetical protein